MICKNIKEIVLTEKPKKKTLVMNYHILHPNRKPTDEYPSLEDITNTIEVDANQTEVESMDWDGHFFMAHIIDWLNGQPKTELIVEKVMVGDVDILNTKPTNIQIPEDLTFEVYVYTTTNKYDVLNKPEKFRVQIDRWRVNYPGIYTILYFDNPCYNNVNLRYIKAGTIEDFAIPHLGDFDTETEKSEALNYSYLKMLYRDGKETRMLYEEYGHLNDAEHQEYRNTEIDTIGLAYIRVDDDDQL